MHSALRTVIFCCTKANNVRHFARYLRHSTHGICLPGIHIFSIPAFFFLHMTYQRIAACTK